MDFQRYDLNWLSIGSGSMKDQNSAMRALDTLSSISVGWSGAVLFYGLSIRSLRQWQARRQTLISFLIFLEVFT